MQFQFSLPHKISRGKVYHFHLIYLPYLLIHLLEVFWILTCIAVLSSCTSLIWFLFVKPRFCIRLPSDSASRQTPLSSTSSSYTPTPTANFHRLVVDHARHTTKRRKRICSSAPLQVFIFIS